MTAGRRYTKKRSKCVAKLYKAQRGFSEAVGSGEAATPWICFPLLKIAGAKGSYANQFR